MANTVMTAKNTFAEGLVMDFAPDNTQATTLTSALNATLLTFNGNEMSLQNDMGNGRVETAYLPEGYVPVGTCEFGDIIYIVSYNPITNKSLIGCFPSPERNISSEEVSTIELSLSWVDFLVNSGGLPSGQMKNLTLKKILYENALNSGDKFIIYTQDNHGSIENNSSSLSDFGNTSHVHGYWPKLTKIHVVSIEDSGKMIYLDSSLKWYNKIPKGDYYIQNQTSSPTGHPDIDSYRSTLSSAYSIFQSKISGKLALLIELEKIDSFACTYSVYQNKPKATHDGIFDTDYHIYFNTSWSSNHNDVNPSGLIITNSEWDNESHCVYPYIKQADGSYLLSKNVANGEKYDIPIPIASAKNGQGFSYNSLIPINRLYKLDSPSVNYSTYINTDSYNAKIANIVNGIDKITLYNPKRYPETSNENREYYTNLAILEYSEDGSRQIGYYIDSNGTKKESIPRKISDDVVNNYFHKDVTKYVSTISIPSVLVINGEERPLDLSELVWNFGTAPAMPYGVLEYLGVNGTIDFSKINSGIMNLTNWRYYNSGLTSTIMIGFESYPEEGKGVAEVVMEFFDNQGKAAAYHIANKSSFSGVFTEFIELNTKNINYKQNNVGSDGLVFQHKGLESDTGTIIDSETGKKYVDDAGTIYANALYKVLITIKYCNKDSLGGFNTDDKSQFKYYYRWFYTTEMFNDYYYNVKDFENISPSLTFDATAQFSNTGINPKIRAYNTSASLDSGSTIHNTVGANIYHINLDSGKDSVGNINMKIITGLEESFGVFGLNEDHSTAIKVDVALGESTITKSINKPQQLSESETIQIELIDPVIAAKLNDLQSDNKNRAGYVSYKYGDNLAEISSTLLKSLSGKDSFNVSTTALVGDSKTDIYTNADAYKAYLDSFSLNFANGGTLSETPLTYLRTDGTLYTLSKYVKYLSNAKSLLNSGVPLTLTGIFFNKFAYSSIKTDSSIKCIKSIINQEDLSTYGLRKSSDGHLYFKEFQTIHMGESGGKDTRWGGYYTDSNSADSYKGWQMNNPSGISTDSHDEWRPGISDNQILNDILKAVNNHIIPIVIAKTGSSNGKIENVEVSRNCGNGFQKYISGKVGGFSNTLRIYNNANVIDTTGGSCNDASHVVSFLCFRDKSTGLVLILNDPFASSCYSQGYLGDDNTEVGLYKGQTLADIIGGMYALLYSTISDRALTQFVENMIYLQKFNEYWNKDIVVDISYLDNDISNLILFYGDTLSNYLAPIYNNKEINNLSPKGKDNNINFSITPIKKNIQFLYSVTYDVSDIRLGNVAQGADKVKLIHYDNGNEQVTFLDGAVEDNTLYTIDGSRIIKFSNASKMFDVTLWEGDNKKLNPVFKSTVMKSSFSDLSNLFTISGGVLTVSDITKLSDNNNRFFILWTGTGDDPRLNDISGGSILNKMKI